QIALDLYLTGRENLDIFADLFNLPADQKADRIEKMLEWAKLTQAADRLVQTYSGGMKRQMNLLIGLLNDPVLLFLDEPTLGLDVQARRLLWELIADIKSKGTTIILTTHYLEEANALCDRVGIMTDGLLAALGTPDQLKSEIARDLFQLNITFEAMPPLENLSLPIMPEVTGNRLHFTGSHETLWEILNLFQKEFGSQVQDASYLQPTLDDVVMKVSENFDQVGKVEKP
ncbi:MAG: AAA family ATPase, partial [Anaerolineaceae bacterium]|nr:AAA family ATPase [Anaerolineaceae bacterium]